MNLSATTDFPSLCVEYISISYSITYHISFGLRLDPQKIFSKVLVIAKPFLSFKGIAHAYLLKISITHNKK